MSEDHDDHGNSTPDLFPGFAAHWIDTSAGRIFARSKGKGPAVVLLHGFPQTSAMWNAIAPELAKTHRVVVMDLRGYGWSSAPSSSGGAAYTKRAMGEDVIAVMEALGEVKFSIAGHDRGARVGYRLALDHPGRVNRLALLDIIPTCEVWRNIESGRAPAAHWVFLSQDEPAPEREIKKNPDEYFSGLMVKWAGAQKLDAFHPAALQAYRDAWGDASRIHAFCEDYRAGAKQDRVMDDADLAAGRRLQCPVLALPGNFFLTAGAEPALEVWRRTFAPRAQSEVIDAGHFVAEENPAQCLRALSNFLA
ncbi:MAG: alpha/beta hydrolase [Alphaproteobacteria bacterium]|nr:alpha/beta hydrolase [Alphaproteobacteria bacterium]